MQSAWDMLEYAPVASGRCRGRMTRLAVPAALLLVVVTSGWWWPALEGQWREARVWYWKRQCLDYAPPPETVVYEEEPSRVDALLRDPNYERPIVSDRHFRPDPNVAQRRVPALERWFELTRRPGDPSNQYRAMPILFLGDRTASDGTTRFFYVEYLYPQYIPSDDDPPQLRVCYDYPGGSFSSIGGITIFRLRHRDGPLDECRHVRFYAGQRDPEDASKILIDYTVDGERGRLIIGFEKETLSLWIEGPLDVVSSGR